MMYQGKARLQKDRIAEYAFHGILGFLVLSSLFTFAYALVGFFAE